MKRFSIHSTAESIWAGSVRRLLGPVLALLVAGMVTQRSGWAQAFTDLTNRFAVTKSGLVLNRATNTFNSVVTVTNVSSATIKGPLVLLVSNVSAGSVTLANQSGQSGAGMPYLTLPMPAGGLAPGAAIPNAVLAFNNPTRISFTFNLAVGSMEGALLPGAASAPAISALPHMPPVGVDPSLIQNGTFLSRISVTFAPGATVDQINHALALVGGGIVSSAPGLEFVTVAVPVQTNAAGVEALAAKLRTAPGILWAFPGHASASSQLPVSPSAFQDTHLLPTRFPAAWNTIDLARRNCLSQPKLPVLVIDDFMAQSLMPPAYVGFGAQIPGFHLSPLNNVDGVGTHGYDVTTTLAALFDSNTPTGANPVTECLDVTGVQIGGIPASDEYLRIRDSLPPSGRFIVNYSRDFLPECATGPQFTAIPALERAQATVAWIAVTSNRWSDFLVASSAGNCLGDKVADIYRGYEDSRYSSEVDLATLSDATFSFMVDKTLWDARDGVSPNLTASGSDQAIFLIDYLSALQPLLPETNVLVTGSTRAGTTFNDLSASGFSASNIDVNAVGEGVLGFGGSEDGTSFSAPQAAGLASYLWLLSNDLRSSRPVTDTRGAIFENTRSTGAGPTIDAYATVLSLDAPGPVTAANAPIRMALLDVNNDGKFDENDVAVFLSHYLDANGNPTEPTTRDYSRYDLNGDGFTGGSQTEAFDLDRASSAQYGKTIYGAPSQQIEDVTVSFDSNHVTDMEVLCYYAYSGLYTGDAAARTDLLDGCAGVRVKIDPPAATLQPGASQQFLAKVRGTNDPRVTWTATGGTISDAGLFTAGQAPGTFTVRARSMADASQFAEATVTVSSANKIALTDRQCFSEALGANTFAFSIEISPPKFCLPLPPYTVPAVTLNGATSVFTYSANYTEGLSADEIASNSISHGTLEVVAEVDTPGRTPGVTPNPLSLKALSGADVQLKVTDLGTYDLTVNGSFSTNNSASSTDNATRITICTAVINCQDFKPNFQTGPLAGTFTLTTRLSPGSPGHPAVTEVDIHIAADSGFTSTRDDPFQANSKATVTFSIQRVQ